MVRLSASELNGIPARNQKSTSLQNDVNNEKNPTASPFSGSSPQSKLKPKHITFGGLRMRSAAVDFIQEQKTMAFLVELNKNKESQSERQRFLANESREKRYVTCAVDDRRKKTTYPSVKKMPYPEDGVITVRLDGKERETMSFAKKFATPRYQRCVMPRLPEGEAFFDKRNAQYRDRLRERKRYLTRRYCFDCVYAKHPLSKQRRTNCSLRGRRYSVDLEECPAMEKCVVCKGELIYDSKVWRRCWCRDGCGKCQGRKLVKRVPCVVE